MWSQNTVSCYDDYAVWSRSSFFLFEKSVSRKELSIDLRASIEGQYSSARLEPAFLAWWYGTRIELVYFELVGFSDQKYTAYDHFQGTGSYGKKKKKRNRTKYEQIRTLGFPFGLPCHIKWYAISYATSWGFRPLSLGFSLWSSSVWRSLWFPENLGNT